MSLAPELARTDFAGARWRASPNFGARYDGKAIDAIVLHYTGMEDGRGAEDWLCDPGSGVSAHYLVHEDGAVVQMVREVDRAWHAGIGCWHGERDMNSVSIGIEIVNAGHRHWGPEDTDAPLDPFPEPQVEAVVALCLDAMRRHDIASSRVLGHSDLAPHRKRDPGEAFPWSRLCEAGIGPCVEPTPIAGGRFLQRGETGQPVAALQAMLATLGFDIEPTGDYCEHTEVTVRAFQRHWRPGLVDGIADASTIDTLYRLLAGLPADAVGRRAEA